MPYANPVPSGSPLSGDQVTIASFNELTADDNSPAAVLERTRQAYNDTGRRIDQLITERFQATLANKTANEQHHQRMNEIAAELKAARAAHQQWGRMLPRGDTARGNGTSR